MTVRKPRFLAITGPTTAGKTALSLALAAGLPIEVVSMDSRQVYRGMDIGTDKVRDEARAAIPHHGLDLVDPDERYSAGGFARDARSWMSEIEGRGAIPALVGGTGFFLRAVMEPVFSEPPMAVSRVEALRAWLKGQERARLETWVRRLDPDRAELAIDGGPQRMSRTLEVALLSGRPLSWWHRTSPPEADGVPGVVVLLDLPRDVIDRSIEERVARMVERGLVEEVERLLGRGYGPDAPGMTGTGYREIAAYLDGVTTLEEAMADIVSATRRYARRQLTWFRNQLPESALTVDAGAPVEEQVELVLDAWHAAGGRVPGVAREGREARA